MVMEEGTSNSVLNPTEEHASDDDVVLYEVEEPALESPVMEAICENPTRKKRRRWYNAESEIFSRKNNPLRLLYINKMCAFKTPSYSCSFKVIYHGFGPFFTPKNTGVRVKCTGYG